MKKMIYPLALGAKMLIGGFMTASLLSPQTVIAQQATERVYAATQATGGVGISGINYSFSNAGDAVDGDPYSYSEINLLVGALGLLNAHQTLTFTSSISANTTATVKIGTSPGLVEAATTVELQAYNGNTAVGSPVTVGSLVNLLSGGNDLEVNITPTATYDAIRVTLGTTLLSALPSLKVYEAYYTENATGNIVCNDVIDNLNGINTLGVANITGNVANPLNAYDGDEATFATLNMGLVGVAGYVHETAIFPGTSAAGDEVRVLLSTPASLVTADVLSSLSIVTYDGTTMVDEYGSGANLLTLTLLSGSSNTAWASFTSTGSFDRIQVRLGGLAGVLTAMNIHEIQRVIPAPTATQAEIYVYEGNDAVLDATTSLATDNLVWFDALTGGNTVTSPLPTTGLGGTTDTFYAAAERGGCTDASDRAEVIMHVADYTNATPTDGTVNVAYSSSIAITPPSPNPFPNTPVYAYTLVSGTMPPGITLNTDGTLTGTPTTDGTYPSEIAVVDNANSIDVDTFSYTITILADPLPLNWAGFSATVNNNQTVDLKWETRDEYNNSHFVVEKSFDGKAFKGFASVEAQNKAVNQYAYTDVEPGQNEVYYRIQQVDLDGKTTYSRTVSVRLNTISGQPAFTIVPNPSIGKVTVNLADYAEVSKILITDLAGKVVVNKIDATSSSIQVNLAPGVYLINAFDANGNKINTQKAVVR